MKPTRLNAFQQIMRLWDQVHPYNAIHAITINTPQSVERLNQTWRETLAAMGVGRVIVDGVRYTHTAARADDPTADLIVSGAQTLDEILTEQINLKLGGADVCPFRAFVLNQPPRQIIGITYHHWVADSYSIRRLFHQWFARLFDPAAVSAEPVKTATQGLWKLFGPNAAGWRVDDAFGGLLRYVTRFARARRCRLPMGDCTQAVTTHALPDGLIDRVAALARAHGYTVNDVLVALLLLTVARFGVNRRSSGRDELAIGTVADLRGAGQRKLENFGLFLGFTTTLARPADLQNFPQLLRRVARQNAFHKKTLGAHTSLLRMGIGLAEAKLSTPHNWAAGYRNRMPLASSISNVNMNREWAAKYHPTLIRAYHRVTPTGPMIPLLFTPTTLGTGMNFCLTRQAAQIDASRDSAIAKCLIDGMQSLAATV